MNVEDYTYPLIREYHEEYEDIYVGKDLPGGFSRLDLYFFIVLSIMVIILLLIQGERGLNTYLFSILFLGVISILFKGLRVGLARIGYKPYEIPYVTRLAEDFLIWARDPALEVQSTMKVALRPPGEAQHGVIYLYNGDERHITFISYEMNHLKKFQTILIEKYRLDTIEYKI